ncbi:MAG: polymerase protein [candidate division WWE3 bacterium GW2011_GWC2_44_9]|uniref:DNA polymerase I n=1 Tax=candidate division WWE3 bacterium GW2011_GWC2_44_9 TaxID=1619125 RepID=A0A0G1MTN6_UNCKA|nr:MAG: polymerase protein [candidate division WWE3 bacterium GW2011_GWC2_44_9]
MDLKFRFDDPQYVHITNPEQAAQAVAELEKHDMLGVDIEGTGLDPYVDKLLLVQVGTAEKSYIFDAQRMSLFGLEPLIALLENPKIIKLMHNGKFDYGFIKLQVGAKVANIYDTMLAEGILTAGIKHLQSLAALSEQYLETRLNKSVRKSFEELKYQITEDQLKYSALDTLVLFPIFDQQFKRLKEENLVNIAKLEFAVTVVVAEMELKGIYIDVDMWRKIIDELRKKRVGFALQFQDAIRPLYEATQVDLFGVNSEVINMNSQPQLMDLFNNKLGVIVPSTGDEILVGVDHPVAKILRDYRAYEKLISAFGESLLAKVNKKTGRLHPDFMQLGTATGRFACANPNLQQIPRNSEEAPFRKCFKPAAGYKLVVTDYSSMEMRILASLSKDKMLVDTIKNGYDIHSRTASLMWGLEYSADFKKKYPEQRQAAKIINFGLVYGMGPGGLARQIGKSMDEARELMDVYFRSYPDIKKWLNRAGDDAVRRGWSVTPAGRKRWYHMPETTDPDYKRKISQIQREAKNHPIQGTNADVTKYALVFMQDRLKKEGVDGFVTHTVHDEVVCEVREDQAEDWAKIQVEEMVRAGELIIKDVPIASEPFVGDVWEH